MRIKLTPAAIAKLTTANVYWDQGSSGFGVVVTPAGHKSFVVQYRANGKSRRATLNFALGLECARREARKIQGDVARGLDPVGEKRAAQTAVKKTLKAVFDAHERSRKFRSAAERQSIFTRLVHPALGNRPIGEISRDEITAVIDDIEERSGARTADVVYALLRGVMYWHETKDSKFVVPFGRRVDRRDKAKSRDRTLNDDEIRALWVATADLDQPFNRLVRFALLTAVRRDEAAEMRWQEVNGDRWVIPAARYKTSLGTHEGRDVEIPLSRAAQSVLVAMPKIGTKDWVFTTDGDTHIGSFSRRKKMLDVRMLAELRRLAAAERGEDPEKIRLRPWRFHDLRRSARTLMAEAGVPSDHAERCLGHVIGGVRGVYDRHAFSREKREAFEALAAQIERILNPADNVVLLRGGKAG
jgi:integrase